MSLINEALKKAQKQRTGESTPLPAIGGESAERIARRSKPAGLNTLLLRLGIGATILAVVVIAGVSLLRKNSSVPVTAPAPAPVPTTTAPKPAEPVTVPVTPAPAIATPSTATPAPAFVVTTATAPTPPKTEAPVPVVILAPAAPVPVPPKPEPANPARPGKLEPRAINFIESLHIAGIRASASESKVLMNDRVYRLGSVVEADMGLRLTGITTHSLTFEDEYGASYTRTF